MDHPGIEHPRKVVWEGEVRFGNNEFDVMVLDDGKRLFDHESFKRFVDAQITRQQKPADTEMLREMSKFLRGKGVPK